MRLGIISQELEHQSIDRYNSADDWAIDDTDWLVSRRCGRCRTAVLNTTLGQVLAQEPIGRHNSIDDWAIDDAEGSVSRRVGGSREHTLDMRSTLIVMDDVVSFAGSCTATN